MTQIPESLLTHKQRYLPLLSRLASLFREMDRAYAAIADRYGFQCNGCADNCCLTRFHHHTLAEYLYLAQGLRTLEPVLRQAVRQQALTVCAVMTDADRDGERLRILCPLNRDGRCGLYAYRPMICRLHGLPHELHRPAEPVIEQPGCDAFFSQCRKSGKTTYIPFDRTPFYRQMALLENDLRLSTGYTEKIKLTIAQMLVTFTEKAYEID